MTNNHTLRGEIYKDWDGPKQYPLCSFTSDKNGEEILGIEDIELQADLDGTRLILTINEPSIDIKIGRYNVKTYYNEEQKRSMISVKRDDCPNVEFTDGAVEINIKTEVLEIQSKY